MLQTWTVAFPYSFFRDMNGRFFGGRKITASFYDEDKFARGEIAPLSGEW